MERDRISSVLRQVACENDISVDAVYHEIENIIEHCMGSEDPTIRKRWEVMPCRGNVPTVEELMEYLLREITGRG